jgi:hypothetical protein
MLGSLTAARSTQPLGCSYYDLSQASLQYVGNATRCVPGKRCGCSGITKNWRAPDVLIGFICGDCMTDHDVRCFACVIFRLDAFGNRSHLGVANHDACYVTTKNYWESRPSRIAFAKGSTWIRWLTILMRTTSESFGQSPASRARVLEGT